MKSTSHFKDRPEMDGQEEYQGFKVWQLRRDGRLKPIRDRLDKMYGVGDWGFDELAADAVRRSTKVREQQRDVKRAEKQEKKEEGKAFDERVKQYLTHFQNATPNDMMLLRQMVDIELQLDNISEMRRDLKDVMEIKRLGELQVKLSAEHRQIQTLLGVDRNSRETQVDAAVEVKRLVDGAKKLLEERSTPIRCPYCNNQRKLNLGFIVYHFRDTGWQFTFTCPNPECAKEVMLRG